MLIEEQLDLVNENDEVVGAVNRADAHVDPTLIHREVGIFLFDNQNKAFVQQRSVTKKIFPLYWICAAAGHVGVGIDPAEVAHKELHEELGFDTKLSFWKKVLRKLPHETHWAYIYIGTYSGESIHVDTSEVEGYGFFSKNEWLDFIQTGVMYDPLVHELLLEYWQQVI